MILKVPRLGHPVLRAPAKDVPAAEIKSPEFQRLIDDMIETMREYNGVGIAGVQVHVPKRVAVIEVREDQRRYPEAPVIALTVLVNPAIVSKSEEKAEDWEGCLSVPDMRGLVPRHRKISVTAQDRDGKALSFEAEDFLARVIQHECDHLDGGVYLDRMKDLKTLSFIEEWRRFN